MLLQIMLTAFSNLAPKWKVVPFTELEEPGNAGVRAQTRSRICARENGTFRADVP